MDILQVLWNYVLPIGSGLTVGTIITAVAVPLIKKAVSKITDKINVEQITSEAVEKGIEEVKNISFKQSIQPLVESELTKVTEKANAYISDKLDTVDTQYASLISVIEKFAAYFDASIAISDTAKEELKKAIEEAKGDQTPTEQTIVVESTTEEQKEAETKTTYDVER